MIRVFKNRNVQLAAALCLPLILLHFSGTADLGYFVLVPIITLSVLILSALASQPAALGENNNG